MTGSTLPAPASSPNPIPSTPVDIVTPANRTGVRAWVMAHPDGLICGSLLAIAAAVRLLLLHTVFAHIDSDQAIVGLMALHIQTGDRPLFYYGQPYQGSLEAYLAASVFGLFGANEITLRLPTLLFSLLFVGLVYMLGRALYGRPAALLSGLCVALGPSILLNYSTAAGYSYIEAIDCGLLLLLLVIRYSDPRTIPLPAACCAGFLCGAGFWIQPLMAEFIGPAILVYTLRLVSRPTGQHAAYRLAGKLAAAAIGALIGAAPLLVYNLAHHWATFSFLHGRVAGSGHLQVAARVLTESAPILLGLITPTSVGPVFARLIATHPVHYWAGIIIAVAIVLRCLVAAPRLEEKELPLLLVVASALAFFIFTGFGAMPWATRLPRYLLPLYAVTPLFVRLILPGQVGTATSSARMRQDKRSRRSAAGQAGSVLAIGALLATGMATTLSAQPRPSIADLDRLLLAHRVRVAYSDYWLANRIAFDTHEQVVGIPILWSLRIGQERVPGYLSIAARTPPARVAWIVDAHGPAEQALMQRMRRTHTSMQRIRWNNLAIYVQSSFQNPPVHIQ